MRSPFLFPALLALVCTFHETSPASVDLPAPTIVHAGPISAKFADGQLRYLCAGGREIARRLYFAVRDDHWGTISPEFTRAELTQTEDSFTIKLEADCKSATVDYTWKGTITGTPSGEITFEAEGVAHRDFRSNRIGLCLLFGAEALAGLKFETADETGQVTRSDFPRLVSPVLLADKFQELRYATADLMEVKVRLEGGSFGMEDQRNYGDSSYKAFAPFGYQYPEVPRNAAIRQKLTLGVFGARAKGDVPAPARLRIGGVIAGAALPKITQADPAAPRPPSFDSVNRNREKYAGAKEITIPFNPTAHLRDDDALMENATVLLDQARTIRSFAPDAIVRIGPINFAPASADKVDPRSERPFGAAWSVRVLRILAAAGVGQAAFAADGSPAMEMRRDIGAHAGAALVETEIEGSCHSLVDALCLESEGNRFLWVVNLTGDLQELAMPGQEHPELLQPWEVREMDSFDAPKKN